MIQKFQAKYPRLEAIEVAVIEDGRPSDEHGFVLRDSGQVVDAETFLSLYEPVSDSGKSAERCGRAFINGVPIDEYDAAIAVARRGRKPGAAAVKKTPKPRRKKAIEAAAKATLPPVADGTMAARILAFLAKEPMTSGELLTIIGGGAGSVYTSLHKMRKAGRIETKVDESDGLRKNYLKPLL